MNIRYFSRKKSQLGHVALVSSSSILLAHFFRDFLAWSSSVRRSLARETRKPNLNATSVVIFSRDQRHFEPSTIKRQAREPHIPLTPKDPAK